MIESFFKLIGMIISVIILVILLTGIINGISIRINDFYWEFDGVISIFMRGKK